MTFRHVVLFTFTPEASPEQVDALVAGLAALPGQIPEIRGYDFGPDAGLRETNEEFAVVADFDDAESYKAYSAHPAHRRLVDELLNPIVASRHSMQYELRDG